MSLFLAITCAVTVAPKPKVMLLGTYHFANPGLDAVKVVQRDILGEPRQSEVARLVDRLAKFKPTKVLVEWPPDRQASLDEQFGQYLSGKNPLSSSETQQIGFRLAKRFNSQLIAVDHKADMDFDGLLGFAAANGMPEVPTMLSKTIEQIGKGMADMDQRFTVGEILAVHNNPEFQRQGQRFYLDFLKVAKGQEFPGADLVAGWYRRNLVIYQNIMTALKPDDRALIIYGSGHVYYLNQLLSENGEIELVDVRKYLPKPPINGLPGF